MTNPQQPQHVRLEYEMTWESLSSAWLYLRTRAREARWYRVHLYLLLLASSLLLADVLYRLGTGSRPLLEAAIAMLILGLVVNWYWRSLSLRVTGSEAFLGRYVLEADAEGMRLQTPRGSSQRAWTACHKFSQSPRFVFVFFSPLEVFAIPELACRREPLDALLRLLDEHVPSA